MVDGFALHRVYALEPGAGIEWNKWTVQRERYTVVG
jgi:hypothetical protein